MVILVIIAVPENQEAIFNFSVFFAKMKGNISRAPTMVKN